ncbi:ER membrane protein complex subunit 4-like isoform X2 [Mustelus asterias]
MAAGAGLANSTRWHTWTLELNLSDSGSRSRDQQCGQRDSTCPVACSDKQLPDICVQETDRILVEKSCWDIALDPLKQLPMNLFIMYMAANTISILPIMMVCMMAWRPIQALMSMSARF